MVVGVILIGCRGDLRVDQPSPSTAGPLANAGTGSTFLVGTTVTLDGSMSFDPNGAIASYHWELATGPIMANVPADPDAAVTTLVLDEPGTYNLVLTVANNAGATATSSVTYIALAPEISVSAGADQAVPWLSTVQLSGSYEVEAGMTATYQWTLTSRPALSNTVLVGDSTLAPSFVADAEGTYVVKLAVSTMFSTETASVTITSTAQRDVLSYLVTDVKYSTALDRFIIVSDSPPALHIHDPTTGDETVVALSAAPTSVSLEPTGTRAAVGHDQLVTLVDLQAAAVVATYAPPIDVYDLVFDGQGRIHCIPFSSSSQFLYTITISGGAIAEDTRVYGNGHGRLHPDGLSMYVSVPMLWLQRWDLTVSPIVTAWTWEGGVSPQFPDINLWFIQGGAYAIDVDDNVFAWSSTPSSDMAYQSALPVPTIVTTGTDEVVWAAEATTTNVLSVLSNAAFTNGQGGVLLASYDDTSLALTTALVVPNIPYDGVTYGDRPRLVALNAAGTQQYVVVDATSTTAGGITTYPFSVIYPIP